MWFWSQLEVVVSENSLVNRDEVTLAADKRRGSAKLVEARFTNLPNLECLIVCRICKNRGRRA